MSRARLLVVDDKPSFLTLFEKLVGDRMEVHTVSSAEKALGLMAAMDVDVVVTDVRMPGMGGLDLLREIKRAAPAVEVILVTGYGTIPQAVEAMKIGAFSYITKPFDPDEALALITSAATRRHERALMPETDTDDPEFETRNERMQRTLELVRRAARSNLPILLLGEVGTGKRQLARWIHRQSSQTAKPFTSVSAREFDPSIYPNEGTAYVSEIELLSARSQEGWLSMLARGEGPRWIASALEPPEELVETGRLQAELVRHLAAMPIAVPALRERQEDIPILISALVAAQPAEVRRPFTPEALAALVAYDWPGNVRQLARLVTTLSASVTTQRIGFAALPDEITRAPSLHIDPAWLVELSYREVLDLARDRTTQDYLVQLLKAARGNVTRAAQRADVERESLHRLMRKYHLRAEDFRMPRGEHAADDG